MRYNRYVHFGAARTLSAWLVVLDPLCALCRTRHGTNRSRAGRGGGRRRCTGDQDRAGHWIFGLIAFSSSQTTCRIPITTPSNTITADDIEAAITDYFSNSPQGTDRSTLSSMINSLTSSTAASVLSAIEDDIAPTDLAADFDFEGDFFSFCDNILDERNDCY